MDFLTTGAIAKRLGVDRDVVAYALRKGRVEPIGFAGQVRLFSDDALIVVREFVAHRRRATGGGESHG